MKPIIRMLLLVAACFALSCTQDSQYSRKTVELEMLGFNDSAAALSDGIISATNDQLFEADSTKSPQAPGERKQRQPVPPIPQNDWDKKIIKTASLNAEVKDFKAFYASLREKVKNLGGYIAQEEQNQSEYKIENGVIIKVPVDQFDNAIVQLTDNIEKINEKKITSQDVTTEIVDTKSRMEAKKQVRLRYIDLLKQAKNMEEILNVQSEINGVQEQIESAAGRLSYLGHSSTFSIINLTYYQVLNSSAKDTNDLSFGSALIEAFSAGWVWIGKLFIGLVSIWPFFLFILIGFIVYKKASIKKPKQTILDQRTV